jgi:hypothetical protein
MSVDVLIAAVIRVLLMSPLLLGRPGDLGLFATQRATSVGCGNHDAARWPTAPRAPVYQCAV